MTNHPLALIKSETSKAGKAGKQPFDGLNPKYSAEHLVIFRATETDIVDLMAKARTDLPGLADAEVVLNIVRYNPDCVFGIASREKFDNNARAAEGFFAMLPLRVQGVHQLALNTLNPANPDIELIAPPGERPAGIYLWCVYAPGKPAGISLFMQKMNEPLYQGLPIYTRVVTEHGRRYLEKNGFRKGAKIGPTLAAHLYEFSRTSQPVPLYDSYRKNKGGKDISVTVARTFEDLMRVVSLRSAVYIGEQECPYEEEFDGNDLAASHLIGYIGDEPAGCLRIRYFADFAKLERLAIRKEYRQTRLAFQIVRAGIQLCQAKGYQRLYGHSQKRLANFWSRFGFRVMEGGKEFVFSDFDYVEMIADIERDPNCIALGTEPYVIIRPEGRWHAPGVLEHSAARSVTRPSVDGGTQ